MMQQADTLTRSPSNDTTALWDWRRRINDLYSAIRANPDPEAAWHRWRTERNTLFASHSQSPLDPDIRAAFTQAPFTGINTYDYDPALRLSAQLDPIDEAPLEQFPAGAETITLRPFARTNGLQTPLGAELTLYWITGYGGGVFLPFADTTNRSETFAAGRYLLDTIKGADLGMQDHRVLLDFNFAYYPSCAYSPRWVCPLAPPANRLPKPVRGGERD